MTAGLAAGVSFAAAVIAANGVTSVPVLTALALAAGLAAGVSFAAAIVLLAAVFPGKRP